MSGTRVVGMAYPYGTSARDERVMFVIERKTPVRYARNTVSTYEFALQERFLDWCLTAYHREDLFSLADRFLTLDAEADSLFYVWGHSYEFDMYDDWGRFEEFCQKIAGKPDIQYVTN